MRYVTTIICSVLLLLASPVYAGSGHDHGHGHSHDPVTKSQAEDIAIQSVAKLVERDKIDASWKSVDVWKSEKKQFGNNLEWVVVFSNVKVSDPAKQTLYIFLTLEGEYVAANYTGN